MFFHTYSRLLFYDNCILACQCRDFPDTVGDADREGRRLSTELGMVSAILGGTCPVICNRSPCAMPSLSVVFKREQEMGGTDASESPEVAQGGLFLLCVRQKDAVREQQGRQRRAPCDVGSSAGLELSWEACCEASLGTRGQRTSSDVEQSGRAL